MIDEYMRGREDAFEDAEEAAALRHVAFLTWLDAEIEAARQVADDATRSALERVKARLVDPKRPGEPHNGGIRGVTFPCENCGAKSGSFLDNGFNRCNACGFPSK